MQRHGAQDIGAPAGARPTLRREQTVAEEILSRSLRDRQLGAKFRRQVPVGAFTVDFACVEARLVVEVDGPSHETLAGAAQDIWRDRCLRGMGWHVVRVPNALVIAGGDLALAPIRAALDERCPRCASEARPGCRVPRRSRTNRSWADCNESLQNRPERNLRSDRGLLT